MKEVPGKQSPEGWDEFANIIDREPSKILVAVTEFDRSGGEMLDEFAKIAHSTVNERGDLFNGLSGCLEECARPLELKDVEEELTEIVENEDTITAVKLELGDWYQKILIDDVESLVEHLAEKRKYNDQASQQILESKKTPKDHIIDATKIARGVLAAMAISRILWRDK